MDQQNRALQTVGYLIWYFENLGLEIGSATASKLIAGYPESAGFISLHWDQIVVMALARGQMGGEQKSVGFEAKDVMELIQDASNYHVHEDLVFRYQDNLNQLREIVNKHLLHESTKNLILCMIDRQSLANLQESQKRPSNGAGYRRQPAP